MSACIQERKMESPNEDRDLEVTSKRLFSDVSDVRWNFSLDHLLFKADICDLLLNAIDEQLDKLQIQHPKKGAVSSKQYWNNEVNLRRSKSLSKDENLGQAALNETLMSCFDLMHSSAMEEKSGCCCVIKSVPDLDDHQWSTETSTQTRSEPNSTLERRCSYQCFHDRSPADQSSLYGRKEYWRCRPKELQKQRNSESYKSLGDFECLTDLHHCKQTWKDGSCNNVVNKDELKREPQRLKSQLLTELKDQGGASTKEDVVWAYQSQRTAPQPHQDTTMAGKESARIQEELENHDRCKEELEAECQRLQLFLEQRGVKQEAGGRPQSLTVTDALERLRTLGEQLRLFAGHLQQELESQKQACEALKKEKQTALSIQRQQLCIKKDQALISLRDCKEHVEELCSLKCTCKDKGGPEWEGEVASLHRQLQAKDMELRHIKRNMDQWKEQTATRLACKFEEALIDELERCRRSLIMNREASNTQVVGSDEERLGLKTWLHCNDGNHVL